MPDKAQFLWFSTVMADGSPAEKGNEVIEFQFVKSSFSTLHA